MLFCVYTYLNDEIYGSRVRAALRRLGDERRQFASQGAKVNERYE
jgi:hypothetical protein